MPFIACRQISETLWRLRRKRSPCGTTSRRSREASGFAGSFLGSVQRRGTFASRKDSQSSRAACAAPVAGPAVRIVRCLGFNHWLWSVFDFQIWITFLECLNNLPNAGPIQTHTDLTPREIIARMRICGTRAGSVIFVQYPKSDCTV